MISVIVPVYNVEKYLDRCVESILAQTFNEYELILVDDGSTDGSGVICDRYAELDNRIRVIHKENGGLSDARNVGTENAKGEYVTYIDSDDCVHNQYLELLHYSITKYNADISLCNLKLFYEGDDIDLTGPVDSINTCYEAQEALNLMLSGAIHGSSACGMLIPMDLARNTLFPINKYHEDDYTSFKYYLGSEKVANVDACLYFYLQRRNSIMHKGYNQAVVEELNAADYIYQECKKQGKDFIAAATIKKFSNYYQVLVENPEMEKIDRENYCRVIEELKNMRFELLFNKYSRPKMKIAALLLCVGGPSLLGFIGRKYFNR
ncbi:MAG: glycosyltransferase [Cellulosilyticum sp.]|nr:glycosyltransferase [Cellulosilyticum sp.]